MLDEVAQRYAEDLFNRDLERIVRDGESRIVEVRRKFRAQNSIASGAYITAINHERLQTTRLLADARFSSLVAAYDKSGIAFDDNVFEDISNRLIEFCRHQRDNVIASSSRTIQQTFAGEPAKSILEAVASETDHAVSGIQGALIRNLRIRRNELLLEERRNSRVYGAGLGKKWDIFISHASEDKDRFVRPLAAALSKSGLTVWYDETTLSVGDRLRQKIDQGLANSRYGVVVLSPSFFSKKWPQQELDGLENREIQGIKVILPVWLDLEADDVIRVSPVLSTRLAARASDGIDKVVKQLRQAMGL